ncbi:hypothetical protein [Streptococcus oricebi]|uniref:Cingulin n=1 Tax=Streptococcus oricebi TaxID=1547447 RepID=A0ABS5B245_9STRE|nr:hypothetical protein [Streptococcus oricebi]MBP2622563.1 hypothetical protein [Streptococcus oricebi]
MKNLADLDWDYRQKARKLDDYELELESSRWQVKRQTDDLIEQVRYLCQELPKEDMAYYQGQLESNLQAYEDFIKQEESRLVETRDHYAREHRQAVERLEKEQDSR